jgi:uncharacterized membrane protein YiaA
MISINICDIAMVLFIVYLAYGLIKFNAELFLINKVFFITVIALVAFTVGSHTSKMYVYKQIEDNNISAIKQSKEYKKFIEGKYLCP